MVGFPHLIMLVYRMVCSLFFLCDTPIVCALGAHQSFTNRVGAKIGYSHPRSCSTPLLYSPQNNIFHHNIPTSTMVSECENRYANSLVFFENTMVSIEIHHFCCFFLWKSLKNPMDLWFTIRFSLDFNGLFWPPGVPWDSPLVVPRLRKPGPQKTCRLMADQWE